MLHEPVMKIEHPPFRLVDVRHAEHLADSASVDIAAGHVGRYGERACAGHLALLGQRLQGLAVARGQCERGALQRGGATDAAGCAGQYHHPRAQRVRSCIDGAVTSGRWCGSCGGFRGGKRDTGSSCGPVRPLPFDLCRAARARGLRIRASDKAHGFPAPVFSRRTAASRAPARSARHRACSRRRATGCAHLAKAVDRGRTRPSARL